MNGASPPQDNPQTVAEVVRRLAAYWRVNPLAGDATEGITQWWLGLSPASVDLVERALRWMVSAGLLVAVAAADGRVHYRRVSLDASIDAHLDRLITSPSGVRLA
jgi:hypothetical protein